LHQLLAAASVVCLAGLFRCILCCLHPLCIDAILLDAQLLKEGDDKRRRWLSGRTGRTQEDRQNTRERQANNKGRWKAEARSVAVLAVIKVLGRGGRQRGSRLANTINGLPASRGFQHSLKERRQPSP
jgi:hypothetical protein